MDLFIKLCLVILGTFLSSFLVLNECKKLDGYKFPVYSTSFCPRSKTEWENRSIAINCTARNGYMCMPNENLTELLEFCYTEPRLWILKGYCFYLAKRVSKVNTYDCSHFSYGCHNYSYLSTRIYEPDVCHRLRYDVRSSFTPQTCAFTSSKKTGLSISLYRALHVNETRLV